MIIVIFLLFIFIGIPAIVIISIAMKTSRGTKAFKDAQKNKAQQEAYIDAELQKYREEKAKWSRESQESVVGKQKQTYRYQSRREEGYIAAYKASEIKKNHSYVVIDFETTGLSSYTDEIIEYAAIKINDNQLGEQIHSLCKPLCQIPDEAIKIHGITNKMVELENNFESKFDKFYEFTKGQVIVGHNALFDLGFLNKYCILAGKPTFKEYSCTMEMAKTLTSRSLPNYQLKTVANYYGIEVKGLHRSLADATSTAMIFIEMINQQDQIREANRKRNIEQKISAKPI